jgi:hypothetical protein
VAPLAYEIFKVLYKEEPIEPEESEDETEEEAEAPNVKPGRKRLQPVSNDAKLRGFRGSTFDLGDDLDYFKICRDPALIIHNDEFKVRVKHCIQNRV